MAERSIFVLGYQIQPMMSLSLYSHLTCVLQESPRLQTAERQDPSYGLPDLNVRQCAPKYFHNKSCISIYRHIDTCKIYYSWSAKYRARLTFKSLELYIKLQPSLKGLVLKPRLKQSFSTATLRSLFCSTEDKMTRFVTF